MGSNFCTFFGSQSQWIERDEDWIPIVGTFLGNLLDSVAPEMAVSESTDDYINHGRKVSPSNFAAPFLCSHENSQWPSFWILFTARFLVDMDVWLMAANRSGTDQIFRNMAMFPGTRTPLQYTTAIQPRNGRLCWFSERRFSTFFTLENKMYGKPKMEVDGRWVSFSIGWFLGSSRSFCRVFLCVFVLVHDISLDIKLT